MEITHAELDRNLQADLTEGSAGFEYHEVALQGGGNVQVAFNVEINRAGLVYVGSGSDGSTHWTDATSVADAVERFETDRLIN